MRVVGSGSDEIEQSYLSDYSRSFSVNDATSDATIYAIRFKARVHLSCVPFKANWWDYDAASGSTRPHTYPSAFDNSMKCAYRFRRVGGKLSWVQSNNENLTNRLIIDVVYLGEESSPTELEAISDDSWWVAQSSAGKVISRTFPASGYIYMPAGHLPTSHVELRERGLFGPHSSYSQRPPGIVSTLTHAWFSATSGESLDANRTMLMFYGLPVRLFSRPN